MSGVGGGGIGIRAGDDGEDAEEIRRGEGGYNRGTETGGGVGVPGDEVEIGGLEGRVRQLVAGLEARIKELEQRVKVAEGNKFELVNAKT